MSSGDASHRATALRHAVMHDRPGLWGDDAERPTCVVWIRPGDDGGLEAFAEGAVGSSLEWLAFEAGGRPVALLAPASWEGAVRSMGGRVETGVVENWVRLGDPSRRRTLGSSEIRRLGLEDAPAFEAAVPAWALRSWGDFSAMIESGAAFGFELDGLFASVAWTYESDGERDKIGVATLSRYRRLGLGRAVASCLIGHIERERGMTPLWVTTPENAASRALAGSLGFVLERAETLLRWTPA